MGYTPCCPLTRCLCFVFVRDFLTLDGAKKAPADLLQKIAPRAQNSRMGTGSSGGSVPSVANERANELLQLKNNIETSLGVLGLEMVQAIIKVEAVEGLSSAFTDNAGRTLDLDTVLDGLNEEQLKRMGAFVVAQRKAQFLQRLEDKKQQKDKAEQAQLLQARKQEVVKGLGELGLSKTKVSDLDVGPLKSALSNNAEQTLDTVVDNLDDEQLPKMEEFVEAKKQQKDKAEQEQEELLQLKNKIKQDVNDLGLAKAQDLMNLDSALGNDLSKDSALSNNAQQTLDTVVDNLDNKQLLQRLEALFNPEEDQD
jgi:hypothetical protein